VVLLPTPPLPDDTAITFATPGSNATPRCTWCAMTWLLTATSTWPTPATDFAAAESASRTSGNWLRAGYPSSMSNATAPSAPRRRFFNWRAAVYGCPVCGSMTVASAAVSAASETDMAVAVAHGGAMSERGRGRQRGMPAGRRIGWY